MEIKFFAENYIIDLSKTPLTIQENNSIVSDQMFTKFVFPYEIESNEETILSLGDWKSSDSDLETTTDGYFFIENNTFKGKNEILSVEEKISGQIDFGFEQIPNYDKKMSELPLENFKVNDIYTYAKDIAAKVYPETNFTFPRIYTAKYPATDKMWDAFDGYYNDLKADGSEMRRNYIEQTTQEIYNVNIIHPMPHFLYLLKAGFRDAGFELKGDILTDEDFQDQYVFSNTQYFTTLSQAKLAGKVSYLDRTVVGFGSVSIWSRPIFQLSNEVVITKTGKHQIIGSFVFHPIWKDFPQNSAEIFIDDVLVWKKNQTLQEEKLQYINFNMEVNLNANSVVKFVIRWLYNNDVDYPIIYDVFSKDLSDVETPTQETGVVTNLNEVDLRKAVPNITFGEFVNFAKNVGNYDLVVDGGTMWMNKIKPVKEEAIIDFNFAEIKNPKRTFQKNKSFLLKYIDLDNDEKLDSFYFDKNGGKINGDAIADTNIIEMKGYPMPIGTVKQYGHKTAMVKKDSDDVVQLVTYRGLQNGQNNAVSRPSLLFPLLFENRWKLWLQQRVKATEFNWSFFVNPAYISNINIKSAINIYNRNHLIRTWTKSYLPGKTENEDLYEVNITTETIS